MAVGVSEVTRDALSSVIAVSGGGSWLAQITVIRLDFAGRHSALGGISSLLSGFRDKIRDRKISKTYHNLWVI